MHFSWFVVPSLSRPVVMSDRGSRQQSLRSPGRTVCRILSNLLPIHCVVDGGAVLRCSIRRLLR